MAHEADLMPGDFISVRLNPIDVARTLSMLDGIKNGAPRALTRALNAVADKGGTRVVDEVYKDINLKKADIRAKVFKPSNEPANKATFSRQEAKITSASRPSRLANYLRSTQIKLQDVNGRLKPLVEVKVKRGGAFKTLPTAFLLRLKLPTFDQVGGEKYGIFIREAGKLKHLYGPSISQVYNIERPAISGNLNGELSAQLQREIRGVLAQYGGG